jgi:hypothetical protein
MVPLKLVQKYFLSIRFPVKISLGCAFIERRLVIDVDKSRIFVLWNAIVCVVRGFI